MEVFQRAMEELFAGYTCAIVAADLLVWGKGTVEPEANLRKGIQRARESQLEANSGEMQVPPPSSTQYWAPFY